MTENNITFIPHSDMSIDDEVIVKQHLAIVNSTRFNDATAYLDNNYYSKGFRASLFNNMENKLFTIQEYLLTKETDSTEEIISDDEPDLSVESIFWLTDY